MNEIESTVINILRSVTKNPAATYDNSIELNDQGLDSLDMIDVLFRLQEKFDFEIDEDEVADHEWGTIEKIIAKITALQDLQKA